MAQGEYFVIQMLLATQLSGTRLFSEAITRTVGTGVYVSWNAPQSHMLYLLRDSLLPVD